MEKQINTADIHSKNLLPLIAAASALRKMEILKKLISETKTKKIPFKKIYEDLLQNYLFVGYPSALLSLKLLKVLYPNKRIPKAADMNLYHFRNRGEANCKKVYGNKFEKLISNVKNFSPDMAEWLVLEGYGKVLGRKGLSLRERELCIIATLAVLKFEDQLYSHINGARRAKASVEEIQRVIESLSLIGNRNLSAFGNKVLTRYRKEKGMSQ
ncbi:MAG TPA: carboxymuconolactone decarboxylase family protein [Ignavibacteriaceae bacterium]|nr:carboxymuconolactone decarboxylase family protein [Ignavibacteriaceae bacterium]